MYITEVQSIQDRYMKVIAKRLQENHVLLLNERDLQTLNIDKHEHVKLSDLLT